MKEIICNNELREIMIKAVNLICDAVGSTLGPSGNNVIIDNTLSPYITNDGATIARSISSSDKRINAILEIVKEASLKTDKEVGDGTTTTLVLLQSIFSEGLKEIEKGKNAIVLKRELNDLLDIIIEKINKKKKNPTKEDLLKIAYTSSNDMDIANLATTLYLKMGNKYSIRLDESKNETYYEIKKGYVIEEVDVPNLYLENKETIELNNVSLLLLDGYLSNLELISDILNESLTRDKNLIILADDYSDEVKNELMSYHLSMNKNIFIFKMPGYGSHKNDLENDLLNLTDAKKINIEYEQARYENLGNIEKIEIKKDNITLLINKNVHNYVNKLKNKLETSNEYEKELLENRISKLEKGIATIYVGGNTKTEIKEKIMRFEDVLCSLEVAKYGIVKGEGLVFLEISKNINNKILSKSLETPFIKILNNSGYEYKDIKDNIIKSKYKKIFNLEKGMLESTENNIIDPALVLIESIKNAISIATLLLTTNYLVINEEKEKAEII